MAGNRGGVWRRHSVRRNTVSRHRRVGNLVQLRVGRRLSAPGRARMSAAELRGWFGDVADGRSSCSVLTQALAVWQWWNYCCSHIPANKKALRVNMDETGVCLFQGHGRGNIFLARGDQAIQHVTRGKQRTYLTHVAFLCDDAAIQRHLPQFIIGNESTIPAKQLASLRANCPSNFIVLRRSSSWVNGQLCAWIVRRLAAALAPYMDAVQPILLFDACKQHLGSSVFKACAAACIWPVVVPAKTTWLLQPLDTRVFAVYKAHLMKAYQEERTRTADGVVGVAELLCAIYKATRVVLEGREWAMAFARDGYGATQAELSRRVATQLGLDLPVVVPSSKPTEAQVKLCFPQKVRVPIDDVWRRCPPTGAAPVAAVAVRRLSPRVLPFAATRAVAKRAPAPHAASLLLSSGAASSSAVVSPVAMAVGGADVSESNGPRYLTRLQKRRRQQTVDEASGS